MKKFTAIMMALMMVLTLTQCKPDKGNEGNTENGSKVKVSCVVPINKGAKSEFDNLMTDGTIKWSAGTERIYLAIPDETNPQIVELTAFTTVESNILLFEGEVAEGLVKDGKYEVWYLGNSKNLDIPYVTEEIEDEVIRSISGSIASQSGDLEDLGYCHIAKTTVTAETKGEEVVLSLNGTLKNQIAIAHLNLEGITQLKGDAIVGTEYTLQYVDGAFEFSVTQDAAANIAVTEGTTASYVVLLPNATANVDLKSNTSKKVTFEGGVEANKIYYKHVSDMEFYPLAWEDYEENLINGHEYVDLGLPSGLLWATCNVGAETPEAYGNYYAWGETEPAPNNNYSSSNCQTYGLNISQLQSQGYIDSKGNLTAQHDAATANWGGDWRMPTNAEQEELLNNCTWIWTTQNGVNGYKVVGSNGNSIFLPAAGYYYGSSLEYAGDVGGYWSSAPDEYYANITYTLNFYIDEHVNGSVSRYYGQSVRPVCGGNNAEPEEPEEPETPDNNHEYVDLGLSVKWATCNVGAETPEAYGNYYAWGETEPAPNNNYSSSNCSTYGLSNSELQSQGYIDSEGNLTAQHDAATANWGGDWRMPTDDELRELRTQCTWTWTTQNGVNGYKVTSKVNSNYIFLPAAGYYYGSSLEYAGSDGGYWSSVPDEYYANITYTLNFYSDEHLNGSVSRYYGQSVRPVCGGNNTTSSNFTEDFNAYDHGISNINGWRIFQYDTDSFNWETSNAYAGYDNTSTCIHSLSYATSFLTPDNFIVTTSKYAITSTSTFSFDASPFSPMYKDDKLGVVISEDNENWTVVYTVIFNSESEYGYVNKSVDLSAYAGKNVYIGFRHYDCGSDNSSGVLVDNIVLSDGSAK